MPAARSTDCAGRSSLGWRADEESLPVTGANAYSSNGRRPSMFGTLGPMELGIIALIALLIFGPRQLPKMGRSLGESLKEFRNVGKEITKGFDDDKA